MNRKLLLVCLLFVAPAAFAAWTILGSLFEAPRIYETGANPLDVVTADLNGDGDLDVLTANRDGLSISVFLGDGHGSLTVLDPIDTERGATSLVVTDMNGDGVPDLVASGCSPGCTDNNIMIYHGLGDGGFERASTHSIDGVPYNVAVADFDGDGLLDVAASDYPGQRLLVLLSDGRAGSFRQISLPTGSKPIALAVADLDDDGRPDLISSDHGAGSSSVHLSLGGGEFVERIEVETGELPYSIALGDLDGDQLPDLVVAHSTDPGGITVLQGRGDGTFDYLQRIDVADRLVYVDTADFDNDGRADIVVTREKQAFAGVFLNEGDGLFDMREIVVEAENRIYSLVVTDLDHDPYPDLVTVDYERNTLSVSLGKKPE